MVVQVGQASLCYRRVGNPHWLNSCLSRVAACLPRVILTMRTKLALQAW